MEVRINKSLEDLAEDFTNIRANDNYDAITKVFEEYEIEQWVCHETIGTPDIDEIQNLFDGDLESIANEIAKHLYGRDLNDPERVELGLLLVDEDGRYFKYVTEPPNQMKLFPEMERNLPPLKTKVYGDDDQQE